MLSFFTNMLGTMRIKEIALKNQIRELKSKKHNLDKRNNQIQESNDQLMLDTLIDCLEYFAIRKMQVTSDSDKRLLDRIINIGCLGFSAITGRRIGG